MHPHTSSQALFEFINGTNSNWRKELARKVKHTVFREPFAPLVPPQVFRDILMVNQEAKKDALDFIKAKHAPTAGEVICHTLPPTHVHMSSQCLQVMDEHELSKPVMHAIHMVCSMFQPCFFPAHLH